MTKIALLTATSVAAIALAGAAQAGVITGTISGVAVDPSNTVAANRTFYTVAAERTNAVDNSATDGFIITNTLTTAPSIAVGGQAQNYSVTFDITGGTIPTGGNAALAVVFGGAGTPGAVSVVQGARSAGSITFIVTIQAPSVNSVTVTAFRLTTTAQNSTAEANIAIGSTTQLLAGGVASTIDTTSAATVVRYVNAVGSFAAASKNAKAALPDFKLFSTTGLTNPAGLSDANRTAELATYSVASGSSTNNSGTNAVPATPVFFSDLNATSLGIAAAARDAIVNGATVTVSGGSQLVALTPSLTGITPTTTTANAASATFVLDNTGADLISTGSGFKLTQTSVTANQVAIAATTFTTSYLPTYAGGFTGPTAAVSATPTGVIVLDGVNFIAPWVSGSQAPTQSVIRISNGAASASGAITLRLTAQLARAPGVTTGPGSQQADETCTTLNGSAITVPSNGELQLGSAELFSCFGDFLRGDVQITIQSASDLLTAKMRNLSSTGVFEASLGRFGSPLTY